MKLRNKGKSHGDCGKTARKKDFKKGRILTPEIVKEFAKLLPQVFFLETVAACLNINRTTWRMWLARGREEAQRLALDEDAEEKPCEALYLQFYHTYRQAIARGKTNLLRIISAAAERQWTAGAWLLERRFPGEWGMDRGELKQVKDKIKELEEQLLRTKSGVDGLGSQRGGKTNLKGNQFAEHRN